MEILKDKLSKDICFIISTYLDYSYKSLLKNKNPNKKKLNRIFIYYKLKKDVSLEDVLLIMLRNGYTSIYFDHDTYYISHLFYDEIEKRKMTWLNINPCSSWKYISFGEFSYLNMINIKDLNVLDISIRDKLNF